MKNVNVAELGYSKSTKALELVVPHGTKMAELPKMIEALAAKGFIQRLPRGCPACTSGDNFNIRERLEEVIRVDLNAFTVVE